MLKKILLTLTVLALFCVLVVLIGGWWLLNEEEYAGTQPRGLIEQGNMEHDNRSRTWQAYVPATLAENPALLLVLHGSRGGSGAAMRQQSFYAFDLLADKEGFIVIYADGFEQNWNDCRASASYSANTLGVNDVGFFRALVPVLEQRYAIDPSRVYAAGLSSGGQMAYRLGLEAPELVAGIAAIAASLPAPDNLGCTPVGEPVSTLIINGTEDAINPYNGGLVKVGADSSRGAVLSSVDTAAMWASFAGAPGPSAPEDWPDSNPKDKTTVHSQDWTAANGTRVRLITVNGGGHTIPHKEYRMPHLLGRTSHELTAAEAIWSFFTGEPND